MTTVILRPHKEESLERFHPWVFSGAIKKVVLDNDYPYEAPEEGAWVKVQADDGRTLGVGHFHDGAIAVRIMAFGTDRIDEGFWQERITAAYRLREAAGLVRDDNTIWRLVHGEGDFLPGLVVDVYGGTAVLQAHSAGIHRCRMDIAEALTACVPCIRRVYYKSEDTLPHKNAPDGPLSGWLKGSGEGGCTALENGLQFRIDWEEGQKTGFFIDQRENRALVERYASGREVLNMFCYTGGFSVYALRGGARKVDSVDVSAKAVQLVKDNVALNFPSGAPHEAYAREAFDFMAGIKDKYDMIILDPPAFAKHRDAIRNALYGYRRINARAMEQIRSGGLLFTFSCSQAIDKEMFRTAVFSAAAQTGRRVRIIHQLHQPQDHPVNIFHPEGEYLKGLVLQVE
jgi:23S rRNA (cytosine1962-C5)-methyltransferase